MDEHGSMNHFRLFFSDNAACGDLLPVSLVFLLSSFSVTHT